MVKVRDPGSLWGLNFSNFVSIQTFNQLIPTWTKLTKKYHRWWRLNFKLPVKTSRHHGFFISRARIYELVFSSGYFIKIRLSNDEKTRRYELNYCWGWNGSHNFNPCKRLFGDISYLELFLPWNILIEWLDS